MPCRDVCHVPVVGRTSLQAPASRHASGGWPGGRVAGWPDSCRVVGHPACTCSTHPHLNSASRFFISRILLCWLEMVRSWLNTSRVSAFCSRASRWAWVHGG